MALPYFLALVPPEKQEAPSAQVAPCSSSWVVCDEQGCVCKYWNKPAFQKNKQVQMELHVPDMVFNAYSIDVFPWGSCLYSCYGQWRGVHLSETAPRRMADIQGHLLVW